MNVQRNVKHLWHKYHGLFVNSPVVIIVKSCLHLFKLLSRILAHCSHVICACYQNMLQNLFVNFRQITAEKLDTSFAHSGVRVYTVFSF